VVPTYILGLSAYYHDSAACLVRDGDIVAAAQEERFTRRKHDPGFPHRAVDYLGSSSLKVTRAITRNKI
jgi:predicted NodU family carbamoyl transferase